MDIVRVLCMFKVSVLSPSLLPGLPLRSDRKEKVVESCVRFSEKERGHPSLDVTDTVFSVNKPISLHGVTVYAGSGDSYKYSLSILRVGTF